MKAKIYIYFVALIFVCAAFTSCISHIINEIGSGSSSSGSGESSGTSGDSNLSYNGENVLFFCSQDVSSVPSGESMTNSGGDFYIEKELSAGTYYFMFSTASSIFSTSGIVWHGDYSSASLDYEISLTASKSVSSWGSENTIYISISEDGVYRFTISPYSNTAQVQSVEFYMSGCRGDNNREFKLKMNSFSEGAYHHTEYIDAQENFYFRIDKYIGSYLDTHYGSINASSASDKISTSEDYIATMGYAGWIFFTPTTAGAYTFTFNPSTLLVSVEE